jgi:hypothetical protein
MHIIHKNPNPFSQRDPLPLAIISALSIISFYTSFDGCFGSLSKTPFGMILLLRQVKNTFQGFQNEFNNILTPKLIKPPPYDRQIFQSEPPLRCRFGL